MKTLKTITLVSIVSVSMVSYVFAAWWNPFSWFKEKGKQPRIETQQTTTKATTSSNTTPSEIEKLKIEIAELKQNQKTENVSNKTVPQKIPPTPSVGTSVKISTKENQATPIAVTPKTKICLNGSTVPFDDYCKKTCPDGSQVVENVTCYNTTNVAKNQGENNKWVDLIATLNSSLNQVVLEGERKAQMLESISKEWQGKLAELQVKQDKINEERKNNSCFSYEFQTGALAAKCNQLAIDSITVSNEMISLNNDYRIKLGLPLNNSTTITNKYNIGPTWYQFNYDYKTGHGTVYNMLDPTDSIQVYCGSSRGGCSIFTGGY